MAGYWILGVLAAFGLLSVLWAALGWLLPAGQGCALVCMDAPDEGILTRYSWLQGVGLFRCPLFIVAYDEKDCRRSTRVEIIPPEELLCRLEQERYGIDGTGNGDSSGRHRRRGVSEL